MLDIFPSVETATNLNRFVKDAMGAKEGSETQAKDTVREVESVQREKDVGTRVDVKV
jgi:hypothetical protein